MVDYAEAVGNGDRSPSRADFTLQAGRANLVQQVLDADLDDTLVDILGSVKANGDGRLVRNLPKAHPRWSWLYASHIVGVQGIGLYSKFEGTAVPVDDINILPAYAIYPLYELTIECVQRPFAVVPDTQISMQGGSWYDEDGALHAFNYATEFDRFVDVEVIPTPTTITAQRGDMKFETESGDAPDQHTFVGTPRLYLQVSGLLIRWFNVPYSYITNPNSYFEKYKGRVNQNTVTIQDNEWLPGRLLFVDYKAVRYTPVKPEVDLLLGSQNVFSTAKLCDVEIICQLTRRTQEDAPTPTNKNYVADGHNLQPWLQTREFYYATTAMGVPTWLSFPFEILFTDPNFDNPGV